MSDFTCLDSALKYKINILYDYLIVCNNFGFLWNGDKKEEGGFITVPPSIFLLSPNASVKDVHVWETSSLATEHDNTKESNTNLLN